MAAAIDVWESGSSVAERLREPSRAIAVAWRPMFGSAWRMRAISWFMRSIGGPPFSAPPARLMEEVRRSGVALANAFCVLQPQGSAEDHERFSGFEDSLKAELAGAQRRMAPQLVEEIFAIVARLNTETGVAFVVGWVYANTPDGDKLMNSGH